MATWQVIALVIFAMFVAIVLAVALHDWQIKVEQHEYDKHKED